MSNTNPQNVDPASVRGHICLSFSGSAGDGTGGGVQVGKSLNFALLVPENTSWEGQKENRVAVPAVQLPNPVRAHASLTIDSPFGNTPCLAVAYFKSPKTGKWCVANGDWYKAASTSGIAINCPGDGKIYLTTGSTHFAYEENENYGLTAPLSGGTTAAEVVIGLWCATGETLADSAAFKALEARVTALESGV